jgi:hypothetical protein
VRRQAPPKQGVSSLRQWTILSQRYLDVMRNDRKTLLVLLLQAPLIGLTTLVSMNKPSFDPMDGLPSTAMTSLFLMVIIVMLFGTVNTAREITKEAPVYRRERMVNLRIVPYIGSKIFVVALFVVYQVAVYLAITLITTDYPAMSASLWTQFVLTLLMAAMSGALLGLLISAATSSTDQATALIPVILIPQFIFAGVLMPDMANSPIAKIATSKWAVEAMATLTDADLAGKEGKLAEVETEAVASLPAGASADTIAEAKSIARAEAIAAWDESWREQFGAVFNVNVQHRFLAMGLIMIGMVVLILLFQKRKDL